MLKGIAIGNLGSDPELRYSAGGTPLLRFNMASNSRVKDQDGEYRDRTEWVRVTVFGNRAESLSQYLKKGLRVYVDGKLETRPWTDQGGQVRAGLEILANEVQVLTPREEDQPSQAQPQQEQRRQAPAQQRQPVPAGSRPRPQPPETFDPDDSDLPF